MNKNTFSVSEAISFGWHTFKSNWKFWLIVITLVGLGGGSMSMGGSLPSSFNKEKNSSYTNTGSRYLNPTSVLGLDSDRAYPLNGILPTPESSPKAPNKLLSLLPIVMIPLVIVVFAFVIFSALVSTVMKMGYINLTLDAARGKQVYYKTLLNQVSLKKSYRFLAVSFLAGLITWLGLLLFIIPGICFALKYSFAGFALVDGDLKVGEALKRSAQITKGFRFKLLWLGIVLVLMTLFFGLITIGVGLFIMAVVTSLAMSYVYVKLADQNTGQATTDIPSGAPVQTMNQPEILGSPQM
ncbi:MAG: YciC family protein [Patescibacteria group bacterium]|jgi:hypothetical protein